MDVTYKEWWYKDKMMGVSKKGYFCLFQSYILIINYRCLEDLLLIFGPNWAKTQFSLKVIGYFCNKLVVFYLKQLIWHQSIFFCSSLFVFITCCG